jgi:glycosyltransferase involved in cell wall biosynthesis
MIKDTIRNQFSNLIERPIKVASIAHSAFVDGSGRLRYESFAEDLSIDLTVVIPDRWVEAGVELKRGESQTRISFKTMKVLLPSFPKANWYLHFYPGLSRMLDELAPDILHLWEEPWSVVAAHAACLCQSRGILLILETDQNVLRSLPFPFQQLRRYALDRTDLLIARQQEALNVSRRWGYTGPAAFVEYLVDQTCFRPLDPKVAKDIFNVDGFTLGYVGRLVREKGLFTVLHALKACHQKINFLIMGSGRAAEELRSCIQELGLEDRVRLLDPQSQEGVANFMNSLSALVLMSETTKSWKEQFGRVIIEAQSCGVPVIGSSSGSIPSVTGDGGWIVEEGNSAQLAQLLDTLVADPAQLTRAAKRALQNVERFSRENIHSSLRDAWLAAYESRPAHTKTKAPHKHLLRHKDN